MVKSRRREDFQCYDCGHWIASEFAAWSEEVPDSDLPPRPSGTPQPGRSKFRFGECAHINRLLLRFGLVRAFEAGWDSEETEHRDGLLRDAVRTASRILEPAASTQVTVPDVAEQVLEFLRRHSRLNPAHIPRVPVLG